MGKRLDELGIVNLVWSEDDDGVYADGLQSYEIEINGDGSCELAVFHDDKCYKVIQCVDLTHAASVVYSGEAVCRWNIKNGKTGNGNLVNEKGWDLKRRK